MKTINNFSFFTKMAFFVVFVSIAACQKNILKDQQLEQATDAIGQTVSKVTAWLEKEKSSRYPEKNLILESLKNNLDFSKTQVEKHSDEESLIVVPLNSSFQSTVNNNTQLLKNLLLIVSPQGNIRKGSIVLFSAKAGETITALPSNTFSNFYNREDLLTNGKYTFLNMHDKILCEMEYDNGKLVSYGEKKQKDNTTLNGQVLPTGSNCIAWYLVTTYYLPNGMTYTTSEYLYTTCGNGQGQVELPQPDDPGNGGPDIPLNPQQKQWTVSANAYSYWYVHSTEQLTGNRSNGHSAGGYFTGITHLSENVVDMANTGYVWNRSGVTVSYSGATAQSTVSGILKSPIFPDVNIPPTTKTFAFYQVYP
jgi:hypothetical protein